MSLPNNILQNVQTYNDAQLGYLENLNCFVSNFNHEYKNFQKETANLGDTINLELPNRSIVANGLVASFQGVQQRLVPLICDQAANSSNAFDAQQFVFNVKNYMSKFGSSRVEEISTAIEANVALNAISGVPVYNIVNGQSVPTGALHNESGPYRFYGDGITPINTFQQLAEMEALFRNYGAVNGTLSVYFDDVAVVPIVGSGLNQFVLDRNESMSNSWDLGSYKGSNSRYYKSNLLPIHYAGTAGDNHDPLVLVSTNDPTGTNITQLTLSGISSNASAFKAGDLIQFDATNRGLVYRTFIGHIPCKNLVQFRVLNDVDAIAGTATISITPSLCSVSGNINQNLSIPLVAGMTLTCLPTHRAGLIISGNAGYLAMPTLPDETPFPTLTSNSKNGVSLRTYYGSQFGQNNRGYVTDCLWASLVVPEYSMRVVLPVI